MGKLIVKQPSGLYAVFSTVIDDFLCEDCTADEVISFFIDIEARRVERDIREYIGQVDSGSYPNIRDKRTYEELLELRDRVHGEPDSADVTE